MQKVDIFRYFSTFLHRLRGETSLNPLIATLFRPMVSIQIINLNGPYFECVNCELKEHLQIYEPNKSSSLPNSVMHTE